MPETLKSSIRANCGDFSSISPTCEADLNEYQVLMGNVDQYNIFGDCVSGIGRDMGQRARKIPMTNRSRARAAKVRGPIECINSVEASAYFNQPAVMKAIHVKPPPYTWWVCGSQINYTS